MPDRFLKRSAVTAAQTWQLLHWCRANGGTEFTIAMLSLQGSPAPVLDQVTSLLQPFELGDLPRARLSYLLGQKEVAPVPLWALTDGSISVLQRFFTDGLFMYPTAEFTGGALEDLTVYRSSDIMFGIVSHEGEGLLRLSEAELTSLSALGITTFRQPEWI